MGKQSYHMSPGGLLPLVVMVTTCMSVCTWRCYIIYIFFSIMHRPVGVKTRAVRQFKNVINHQKNVPEKFQGMKR